MTKLIAILFILAMGLHIISPLGFPGLKRRSDFWKIAVAAMILVSLTAALRP
jgi:hypothetical protein